jgi:hypothetical protein
MHRTIDCKPIYNKNDNHVAVRAKDKEKCLPPSCFCETGELIRNGGFEIPGFEPGRVFSDWQLGLSSEAINLFRTTDNVYKGNSAASVQTTVTPMMETRQLQLRQNVTVTPGCLYRLKFAERLGALGTVDTILPILIARIFYVYQGFEYDLLNLPIQKEAAANRYTLHNQTAELPVPCNVSGIVVQFEFFITDSGGSIWNLDAVSLRAVSEISACCCKE